MEKYKTTVQISSTEGKDTIINESAITDLQYKNPSPDFCVRNESIGVLGVEERPCEPYFACITAQLFAVIEALIQNLW